MATSGRDPVALTFEIKAPIFVFRQWHRHRTWSFNEISARYAELPEEFYVPALEQITTQSSSNKQMRTDEQNQFAFYMAKSIEHQCADAFETYNRYVARIVAVMNTSGVSLKFPRKASTEGRIRFLTQDEWTRLYAELPPHLKVLALFSIKTGLRRFNATHLEWDRVDIPRKVMWVYADEMKSKRTIGIPLGDEAIAVLAALNEKRSHPVLESEPTQSPYVFLYRGKPIFDVKTGFHSALKRAGIKNFTWHGLRHTWASWHIMNGTRPEVLQKLGGWNDLRMVMRYAHLDPSYLAQFTNNAKPWAA